MPLRLTRGGQKYTTFPGEARLVYSTFPKRYAFERVPEHGIQLTLVDMTAGACSSSGSVVLVRKILSSSHLCHVLASISTCVLDSISTLFKLRFTALITYAYRACRIYSASYGGLLIALSYLIQLSSPSSSQAHGVGAGVPRRTPLTCVGVRVGCLVGRLVGTFVGRVVGGPTIACALDSSCANRSKTKTILLFPFGVESPPSWREFLLFNGLLSALNRRGSWGNHWRGLIYMNVKIDLQIAKSSIKPYFLFHVIICKLGYSN